MTEETNDNKREKKLLIYNDKLGAYVEVALHPEVTPFDAALNFSAEIGADSLKVFELEFSDEDQVRN